VQCSVSDDKSVFSFIDLTDLHESGNVLLLYISCCTYCGSLEMKCSVGSAKSLMLCSIWEYCTDYIKPDL